MNYEARKLFSATTTAIMKILCFNQEQLGLLRVASTTFCILTLCRFSLALALSLSRRHSQPLVHDRVSSSLRFFCLHFYYRSQSQLQPFGKFNRTRNFASTFKWRDDFNSTWYNVTRNQFAIEMNEQKTGLMSLHLCLHVAKEMCALDTPAENQRRAHRS